jgi:hypothetical protein
VRSGIAAVAAIALLNIGCASASQSKAPPWLRKDAKLMAAELGDPHAKISYVLGPFPIAVVEGDLTCGGCSRPGPEVPAQTGSVAAARYDGGTYEVTDFAILHGSLRQAVAGQRTTSGPLRRRGSSRAGS